MSFRVAALRLLFLAWWVLLSSFLANGQVSRVGATLEATVMDGSGAAISGAQVTLRNTETNQSRTLVTDERGFCRAAELGSGTYQVRVEKSGFSVYQHVGVRLTLGQTVQLGIRLAPATVTEQMTVTDQPSAIDTSQTTVTTTVENERIEELPVRSRNYLDFVLLAPGVAQSNRQQTPSGQSPLGDSGFVFGGLRPRSNNLSTDGLDNNDEYTGSSRTELSLETIQEFQVVNNGLSAEAGGASGGSVNVITKTGTNNFHGDVFIFAQNGVLNARPPLESATGKPDLSRYRGGFSLGGPITKNRTFFYTAAEQERQRAQSASDIQPDVVSALNRFLANGAFPRLSTRQIAEGFFPTARDETEVSGKINRQLTDKHSMMLRYSFTNTREVNDGFNTGGLSDQSSRGSSFTKDNGLVGSFLSLLSQDAVNDARFQIASRHVELRTGDATGPEADIVGLTQFGRSYEGNSRRTENHYEVSDTLTVAKGHHLLKWGAIANRVELSAFVADGFGGLYIFPSLSAFFAGTPEYFRQAFGNPSNSFAVTSYGGFIQEHWTVTTKLTLDIGLRYDFENLPSRFNQDFDNFSPRIGLAFSPSGAWVLRAGYGVFFDRYLLAYLNRTMLRDGVQGFEQVLEGDAAAGAFQRAAGGPLIVPLPGIAPAIYRPQPSLPTPYSQQSNISFEHLLGKDTTASATYLFVRGVKLPRTINVNLPAPVVLTPVNAAALGVPNPTPQQIGREVFGPPRLEPQFKDVYQTQNAANSTYHGVSFSLNRRVSKEIGFAGSYTYSKTLDDASDFVEQPQNPYDLRAERALSRQDQRHRFVFSGLFDLPFGDEEEHQREGGSNRFVRAVFGNILVAPIVTVNSGKPINPLSGVDSNRNDAFPLSSRPLVWGRNSLSTSSLASADLRVVKYLRFADNRHLDFEVEFFNLLNRRNVVQLNPFYGVEAAPLEGFGSPMDAANARQVQFSLDYEF